MEADSLPKLIVATMISDEDVLKGEVDIAILDVYTNLLKNKFTSIGALIQPSILNQGIHEKKDTPPLIPIDQKRAVQVHHLNNHYIVSNKVGDTVNVYNSLSTEPADMTKVIDEQLRYVYGELTTQRLRPYDQGTSNDCGPIAAALAYYACQGYALSNNNLPLIKKTIRKVLLKSIRNEKLFTFDLDGHLPPLITAQHSVVVTSTKQPVSFFPTITKSTPRFVSIQPSTVVTPQNIIFNNHRLNPVRYQSARVSTSSPTSAVVTTTQPLTQVSTSSLTTLVTTAVVTTTQPLWVESATQQQASTYQKDDRKLKNFTFVPTISTPFLMMTNTPPTTPYETRSEGSDERVKRTLNGVSEFLNRTVYGGLCYALRSEYGDVLSNVRKWTAPINSSLYQTPAVYRMRREVLEKEQPRPYFHNPPAFKKVDDTTKSLYEKVLEMRRDVEKEMMIRRSVGKMSANFIKKIVNKLYFNPSHKKPTNLEWKNRVIKLTKMTILPNGERRLEVKTGAISYNLQYMEKVYEACFAPFVQKQTPDNAHKYIYAMTNKINTFASIVNNFGKGQNSALALTFLCFREVAEHKTFDAFIDTLIKFNPGDLVFSNILDIDMAGVFGNATKLFKILNPDGKFDESRPQNALLIADVASDLLPIMMCETLLFALLLHVSIMYDSVYNKVIHRFRHLYETGEGCFTVLQTFPGLFSIICYAAKKHGEHSLDFLRILEGISNSRGLTRERYVTHLLDIANQLGNICLEILDSRMRFDLPRLAFSNPAVINRRRYSEFSFKDFEPHFRNATFLLTNTFVV